jgi:cyclic beta-1,2-glucan synthetase
MNKGDEIYSVERLEQHAIWLAKNLVVSSARQQPSLLSSLNQKHKELLSAYRALAEATRLKKTVSPASEWFVDNFHIIEEQLRDIQKHLPPNYYKGLPKVSAAPLKTHPRVYALAYSFLSHTDCCLDSQTLRRFVRAFQTITPLSIGEIWAVAISLRLALIEFLNPLASRIVSSLENRGLADDFADSLLEVAAHAENPSEVLADILYAKLGDLKELERVFVVQLVRRLRDQDSDVWPAFEWIENRLKGQGSDTKTLTQLEHQLQATAQVTIGNIISSMRLISSLDWKEFFESVSLVDDALSKDPGRSYAGMEFVTRDRYRHVIERLAQRSPHTEIEIAKRTVSLAASNDQYTHVGHFLIGEEAPLLEKEIGYRPSFKEKIFRVMRRHPALSYLGLTNLIVIAMFVPALSYLIQSGGEIWQGIILILVFFVPLTEFALSVVNHYVTFVLKPESLPKLDLSKGIPDCARTMVVVPSLFTSTQAVDELIESLHIHFLANCDENLYFAILSDYSDASTQETPEDAMLIHRALAELSKLNDKHRDRSKRKRFHLFHRRRIWNDSENTWMGWERKRGKLEEFNRLLRNDDSTSFVVNTAERELLGSIKYVITLDSDTRLPRDSARRLVGTILHPLNRPLYDSRVGRVVKGYGILQPRVSVAVSGGLRSRFSKIFSGHTGIDPYTTAVSDVYQDLFGEGSFTGKGLYDVDIFCEALANRVPENTLLSHDLFEGGFARCGLVTDVEVFDDFPSDLRIYTRRLHRWTRGDWQVSPWILSKVPSSDGTLTSNTLSFLSRWKILDNLRRSLNAPMLVVALIITWTFFPGSSLLWTGVVLLLPLLPTFIPVADGLVVPRRGVPWSGYFRQFRSGTSEASAQFFCTLVFLPELAWVQMDAIARTLYRKLVSRRKLLEWVSFAQDQSRKAELRSLWDLTGPAPVVAIAAAGLTLLLKPGALIVAFPIVLLWLSSPYFKHWLCRISSAKERLLSLEEIKHIRRYARRTWSFFETFVSAEHHWLAPDNFQEDPAPVVARRTSPTNIGLQLLSTCSAHDLGYIGLLQMTDSIEKIFSTLGRLERSHGHFYNWYDIKTLKPLNPRYLSTVDSGNLATHLIALKQACLEKSKRFYSCSGPHRGLVDTLIIVQQELFKEFPLTRGTTGLTITHARDSLVRCLERLNASSFLDAEVWRKVLVDSEKDLENIDDTIEALELEHSEVSFVELRRWLQAALAQVGGHRQDLDLVDIGAGAAAPISQTIKERLENIAAMAEELALSMDFKFLFDRDRGIFLIGYNLSEDRPDNSYYDLLASESRSASFFAIAKGDVPNEHWFRLGRQLTRVNEGRVLVSWSGTMFEYLMPLLVNHSYQGTLLEETYHSVVFRQIEYGSRCGVPWGISEAGYFARDLQLNYQYGPFGVPGLGLKRGLSDELVVSPYSTMLAAMVEPRLALENLRRLEANGMLARFGFYESVDYTPERLPETQKHAILKSFMAHHQGMILVSANNLLNGFVMQKRFHADALVRATEMLLQERVPHEVLLTKPRAEEVHSDSIQKAPTWLSARVYTKLRSDRPETQILSNGDYSVLLSTSGSGFSRCGQLAVNRWREDSTRDNWGQFIYLRDRKSGRVWSTAYQPTHSRPTNYEVSFSEDKVGFWRQEQGIITHTEVVVAPEDNVELRRVSLTNTTDSKVEIEVTSYLETVIAPHKDDLAHPAFSNLFVQTEFVPDSHALVAVRRGRLDSNQRVFGFHTLSVDSPNVGGLQYETDRSRFLGRGRTAANPWVVNEGRPLSNTVGSVLDPIFSLRRSIEIQPGETVRACFSTGVASSRGEVDLLIDKYHDVAIFKREAELVWTQTQVQLRHLNISSDKAHVYQKLASRIIYSDTSLRPSSKVLIRNVKTQADLWPYAIGGRPSDCSDFNFRRKGYVDGT